MALNPNRPVGTPESNTPAVPAAAPTTAADTPRTVHIDAKDTMVLKAQKGDTAYALARIFVDEDNAGMSSIGPAISSFAKAITATNKTSTIHIGQTLKLPTDGAEYLVKLSAAVQKYMQTYPDAGLGKVEDFDWRQIGIGNAPDGFSGVAVPRLKDHSVQIFLVSDGVGESDETPTGDFSVTTAEAFAAKYFPDQK